MARVWDLGGYPSERVALDGEGRSLTYADLSEEGARVAVSMGGRCLVFCLCRNEIGSLVGYVGAANNGAVPLLLPSDMDSELLNRLIATYRPSFLWVPDDVAGRFAGMGRVYGTWDYTLLSTGHVADYDMHPDLCLLLTTSGSTGSPKLVRQSYENVRDNASSIAEYLRLDASERPITTLPMNYTYGLSIINSHLLVGATVLFTDKSLMQEGFWSFFRDSGATSFGGVPYTYEMLDRLRFYRMELPSLRTMTQAGGKILPELHEKFARYAVESGRRFVVMYGQCEATARMGYLPPEDALKKKGSMGVAIPGGEFRLVDDRGDAIDAPGVTGELVYSGKNVTMGYARSAKDLARGDERHGILHTGDMAQFDGDGYYYIVGRKKRFLKIYGNRVNLDEVDRMVRGAFGIEAASAGSDDHLLLFVTDRQYAQPARELVIERTGLNPAAFEAVVVDSIPKNEAGKTLYRDLTALAGAGYVS